MVSGVMSNTTHSLPDDPAILKAMIAALKAENGQLQEDTDRMAATLRAHEALLQALQIQIARLRKQKFGASSEKIEREIPLGTLLRNTLSGSGTAGIGAGIS